MSPSPVFGLLAVLSLLPAALWSRRLLDGGAIMGFRACLVLAALGPLAMAWVQHGEGWRTGVGASLWLAVAVSAGLHALLAMRVGAAQKLVPLLAPYLAMLALLALVWEQAPARPLRLVGLPVWLQMHIAVAIVAYGLLTVAAVAGLGVALQERALRRKRPTRFSRGLPAISEGETLQTRLLIGVEILLGLTLLTGMAANHLSGAAWFGFDHKSVLSLSAFAVIGALLLMHARFGLSGRRAARFGLAAYLLLTLAYPGVKFVTDVLLAGAR